MATPLNLTAANSVFMLQIVGLFDNPQLIQGYATDAAFAVDAAQSVEVQKGVDGKMSAGFTPFLNNQTISLQADSPSSFIFEDWMAAQVTTQGIYYAYATLVIPAIRRKYTLTKGALGGVPMAPTARKILQPRDFNIIWDVISPAPM